jgi:hypothetical protein
MSLASATNTIGGFEPWNSSGEVDGDQDTVWIFERC